MLPSFSRRTFTLGLVATFGLLLPPAAPLALAQQPAGAPFPVTITDDAGVSSTFVASPRRVVSLNPGLTEMTFALGEGSRLVAVDTYSDYPPEAKNVQPRLTTYPSPSAETIVGLKPDLVLALAERAEDLAPIRRQGIPVLKLFPRDFDAVVQTNLTLGRLYGTSDRAMAIASDMLARRDAVTAAVADAPRPRVYEELDASEPDKPFVAGPNGFYGQLLDLAGGANIFADVNGDVAQVGAESIVQRDPEVIILTDADLPFNPQTPDMVAARPGWDGVTAVQNGAVYAVPGTLYATPGPRLIDGLENLARLLHPDRFASTPAKRAPVLAIGHER
ncbi:MAG: helical backbone metal receptor [Chloroflexota bacterium]|nr:helical backbone metal receptor [Chloroflexota bacterium]